MTLKTQRFDRPAQPTNDRHPSFAMIFLGSLIVAGTMVPTSAMAQRPWETATDAAWNQQLSQAVMQALDKSLLQQGNAWYARFKITANGPKPNPEYGFAQPLFPNAEPLVREGFVEFRNLRPESYALPTKAGVEWSGGSSVRITQYRIYTAAEGWSQPRYVAIHFWEWNASVVDGKLGLVSQTDNQYGTFDAGPTEFVASVYNVPANTVTCVKPTAREIPRTAPTVPQHPWRAGYNNLAPLVTGQRPRR
jgi:hypothetical protein